MFAGETQSFGVGSEANIENVWVVKLNGSGIVEWQKTYGGPGQDEAETIQLTNDGGYIVAGHTESFGAGGKDIWILKLDSEGNLGDCSEDFVEDSNASTNDSSSPVADTSASVSDIGSTTAETNAAIEDTDVIINIQCQVTMTSEFGFGPSFPATGTNFLDEPDKPDLRLQEFSLASWFKTSHNAVGANAMIVNKGGLGGEGAGENMNYGMYLNWGERLKAGFESTDGTNYFVTSPDSYDNGNAQYGVVTYDQSIIKLYVNGSMVASLHTTAIPDDGSSLPVRVAANSAAEDEFFNGSIDEVRIWNRTLTDQEVSDQYNSALFNTAGQVLYRDMS